MLRLLGRFKICGDEKKEHIWKEAQDENYSFFEDISGGPLLQTLQSLEIPPKDLFQNISGQGDVETALKAEAEEIILGERRNKCGDVLWASSGSDAIELAIWATLVHRKKEFKQYIPRFYIRKGGYHGNTFLTRTLSTRGLQHLNNETLIDSFILDDSCFSYGYANSFISLLKDSKIRKGDIVLLEPIPTTGGIFFPRIEQYLQIIHWCRENSIYIIFDEVACGAYKHGWFSSFDWADEIYPTASCLAKGLTNGMYPLSCALIDNELSNEIKRSHTKIPSFTFGINDASSYMFMKYVSKCKLIISSADYKLRKACIEDFSKKLTAIANRKFQIEYSDTSIRIKTFDKEIAKSLSLKFKEKGFLLYEGSSFFEDKKCYFFIILPSIDLKIEQFSSIMKKILITVESLDESNIYS